MAKLARKTKTELSRSLLLAELSSSPVRKFFTLSSSIEGACVEMQGRGVEGGKGREEGGGGGWGRGAGEGEGRGVEEGEGRGKGEESVKWE